MESTGPGFNAALCQQASDWFVELRAGAPDERKRRAFHTWLKQGPAHMAAYLEVVALWNESARLNVREKWPMERLIEEARSAAENIVPFGPDTRGRQTEAPLRYKRRWMIAAALAGVAIVLGGPGLRLLAPTYTTAIGEQRSIALPDGSTVHLNARSRVTVRYSGRERRIELREGQALFTVAGDPTRPFVVKSEDARVIAVGTQFDVNRVQTGMTVSVVEGRVAVENSASAAGRLFLDAGEQGVIRGRSLQKSPQPAVDAALAWTQRQLVFVSTPLADVAEMFNRYNERQLRIRDPALERFRIDGVFSSTDVSALVQFLRDRPGLSVMDRGREIFVAPKRPRG